MLLFSTCTGCGGTGVRHYWDEDHNEVVENPCSVCNGSGVSESRKGSYVDDTLVQQVLSNQTTILEELDYIHGKVTAIWNQVKPP